ncbi:hypothetical protein L1987_08647 [Smallanthus sonchifolius]|uniref:Uncharacterized protein n=1 Tax=Smallanthus sonchifolius TaxID=185202 RepID=A0ACB9JNG0_9ASTR|nr:hypothetical protein L1987_08647 [Smallanthus sonchifolius]
MNRIAYLAKKNRVTASRVSQKFPPNSNEAKKNQCGSKITIRELISKVQKESELEKATGTIARNHSYASLIHSSWQKVSFKEKIWEYVLEKYDIPDASKRWVLKSIGQSYKKNDDPNQELPTLTQLFERTRKRTDGRSYVDTYNDTSMKITTL